MMNFLDDYGFKIPEIPGWVSYTFCAQYQTVYDSFTEPPAADIAQQQDIMVRDLVAAGLWAKLDVFYIFANFSPVDSQINWINPGTYDLIPVNMIAGDFVAYRGWTGDGIAKYLRTQYTPSLHGVNLQQNSASCGIYIRNNYLPLGNHFVMGATDGAWNNAIEILPRHSDGNAYVIRLNTNIASGSIANVDSSGFYIANRLGANDQDLYKSGVRIIDDNDASTGLTAKEIYILAFNNNGVIGNFTTHQVSHALLGGGLDEAGNSEITNFTTILETYLDYVGAGVIP